MRPELKEIDWHVYGLSTQDYDYTLKIVEEIIEDRKQQLGLKINNIKVFDEQGNIIDNSSDGVEEVISDISYYNYIENLYLWHFALWRLQGIFEGILQQEFFPEKKLQGIKAKLNYIRGQNYSIETGIFEELIEWAKLRNAFSHFPPEQFRPSSFGQEDVYEYFELIKLTTESLLKQKKINAL